MKKVILLTGMMILVWVMPVIGAPGDTVWTRTYGGGENDDLLSVEQTSDGGLILAGWTRSFLAQEADIYLIKTDLAGDPLWSQIYPGPGVEVANTVHQTIDGGFILAGADDNRGFLLRTDSLGSVVWRRTYTDSAESNLFIADVQQTPDEGYIFTGWSNDGPGSFAAFLTKTNENGDIIWSKTYGGNRLDRSRSVCVTTDGGYIISGDTKSFGPYRSYTDIYIVKTDSIGDTLWTRLFGYGGEDASDCVVQTADGGYLLSAKTNYHVYILKISDDGTLEWSQFIDGHEPGWIGTENSACINTASNYIITGTLRPYTDSLRDIFIAELDPSGNTLWVKHYGGSEVEVAHSVNALSNGDVIVGGTTESFGAGAKDFWLLRVETALSNGIGFLYENNTFNFNIPSDTILTKSFSIVSLDVTAYMKPQCDSSWVSFDTDSIAVSPGDTIEVNVFFNAAGLDHNQTYESEIYFQTNSPVLVNKTIPIRLTPTSLTISMIPNNSPVVVPRNGNFTFTGILTNNTSAFTTTDVWIMLRLPNNSLFTLNKQYFNIEIEPDTNISYYLVNQWIPDVAPLGQYNYIAYCGAYPDIIDSCFFPFTVVSALNSRKVDDWNVVGWGDSKPSPSLQPMEFTLQQNSPNPFNPETTLKYSLPVAGDVNLSIYNILGQRVTSLVDGYQNAGQYNVIWNASSYSSGIYFYRLTTGDKSFSKKMQLLK
ncbi:MAG: T9SS type A sorting domain-containing protein [candidate division Zixibacteria bacterium]|nr:T9SS type A sorting domain-containing protein [candidate division Zixibacteria bacterium]